jgi:hypothetical protein
MNTRRRKQNPPKRHIMQDDFDLTLLYLDLLKSEKYWRNSGQYFIAKKYELRAKYLINGDIKSAKETVKTEGLYCPTKKLNFN